MDRRSRGRPKKDMSPEAVKRREVSGSRIKSERHSLSPIMTQEELAAKLGAHEKTIGRYEAGDVDLPLWAAEKLTNIFGGHVDYWRGFSYTKDPIEWGRVTVIATQLKDAAADYAVEQCAKEKYEKAVETIQRFVSAYQTVFHFLGLRYQYSEDTETHMVLTLGGDLVGEFTWDELSNLLVELRDTVEFFGYKKKRVPKK